MTIQQASRKALVLIQISWIQSLHQDRIGRLQPGFSLFRPWFADDRWDKRVRCYGDLGSWSRLDHNPNSHNPGYMKRGSLMVGADSNSIFEEKIRPRGSVRKSPRGNYRNGGPDLPITCERRRIHLKPRPLFTARRHCGMGAGKAFRDKFHWHNTHLVNVSDLYSGAQLEDSVIWRRQGHGHAILFDQRRPQICQVSPPRSSCCYDP